MVLQTRGRAIPDEVVVVSSYTAVSGRCRRAAVVTALSASPPPPDLVATSDQKMVAVKDVDTRSLRLLVGSPLSGSLLSGFLDK